MKQLNVQDMLSIWEQGLNQSLLQRSLILLISACPEMSPETLSTLSIGQRDRYLLQLRERLFGQHLINTAVCPECHERIEWESNVTELLDTAMEDLAGATEFDLTVDGYMLRFRLLNSLDIATLGSQMDATTAQQHLLSRCLITAEYAGDKCRIAQIPESVIDKLNQQIETLDPLADIRFQLLCPECAYRWDVLFDISQFLWTEINEWAERMLQTVHKLAIGYGWSEREILELSPVRRQLYLGMLGA